MRKENIREGIRVKKQTDNHRCGTCCWYEKFTGVCFNGESSSCADFMQKDNYCENWEGKTDE